MQLEFNGYGFLNAISLREKEQFTELRTHLVRKNAVSLLVSDTITTPYEWFVEEAKPVMGKLHKHDFFLNPNGFLIEIDDAWSTFTRPVPVKFNEPAHVEFWPGVRMQHQKVVNGARVTRAFGQFIAPKQEKRVEIFVGNSTRVVAEVWAGESEFHYVPTIGDKRTLLTEEDLLRQVINISRIHQNDREFFEQREAYIRDLLPKMLR